MANIFACSKTDNAGNIAIPEIFTITVQDTTAPVISAHDDIVVEATSPLGEIVNYVLPTATDNYDLSVTVSCVPSSGSQFIELAK